MIASFDVFDTILSRTYATPEDVHHHLEEILRQSGRVGDPAGFAEARWQAEKQAWADRGGRRGAAIDEIYAILAARLHWDDEQTRWAMSEEIRLERNAGRFVPDFIPRLEEARRQGRRVCFISDMHLRDPHIREMLVSAGALEDGDSLFVSSDCAALKSTGELFLHAMKTLQVEPRDMQHTGDNPIGDFQGAKRSGIHATLYTRAQLNRFERATAHYLRNETWRERSLAAVSKFTRLSRPVDQPESALWDLLGSTIAPFVAGYAWWLIDQARQRGIQHLFFLARDMQIVCEVAAYLAGRKRAGVQCHYLYASRSAWQPAGYTGPNEFELFWLTDQTAANRPDLVLRRLLGTGGALLQTARAQKRTWNTNDIRELLESDAVRPAVEQATKEARQLLMAYLWQSGYAPNGTCALVDAGWRGSLQNSLAKAYRLENSSYEILAFYIGLRHLGRMEPGCILLPYLSDRIVERHGFSLVSLIEGLLTANHGSTLRYEARGSRVEPVLEPDPPATILKQWNLVRDCCIAYAEQLAASPAFESSSGSIPSALAVPLVELCRDPTPAEAELFTGWFFDGGRGASSLRRIAGRIGMKDLAKLLAARLRSQSLADVYLSSPWLRGAVAVSPPLWRAIANLSMSKDKSNMSPESL